MLDKNTYYFLETVKKGSLTKAASSLSISQPALSMGLNSLENKLGFRLLNRKTNPVSLTSQGKIYLNYVNSLNVLNINFEKEIADCNTQTNRKITIGAPLVYAETLIADFIAVNGPDIEYIIKVGSQSELQEMLDEAMIDCYISTSNEIDKSLQTKLIKQEKINLCIPKEIELGKIDDYAQLSGMNFIMLEDDQPLQKVINTFIERYDIDAKCSIVCNQVSTCISLSHKSKHLCFASLEALQSRNMADQFDILELPDDLFKRNVYLVYDDSNFISEVCRNIIEII